VDGLTIPDPSPARSAYVDEVTNPWLALAPGATWVYRSDTGRTRTVSVSDEHVEVDGVTTTVVHTEEQGSAGEARDARASRVPSLVRDDLYAQDRAGNVWLLGQRVLVGAGTSWQAGVDGAAAGLAMAATPRRGDGYAVADAPGADEDRALVLSLDARTTTPLGSFDHALLVEYSSRLAAGTVLRRTYARGVGLVAEEGVQGNLEQWQLTSTDGSG
jgi:hypothetical protein